MTNQTHKTPSLWQSLLPIIVLIGLLSTSVMFVWGSDSLGGGNQMALLFSAAVAMIIGNRLGYKWNSMLKGATDSINTAMPAVIILLLIGALAGTWLISGIVPTMIYYGLQILNPTIFLFSACVISAIVSLATGSSWSTIATVGVALLGIGQAMDIHSGLIAGSIISGAYFGDKMSPMSDTTNLAPAVSGTDLITHIKYMLYTTIPSIVITLIIFLIIGFFLDGKGDSSKVDAILIALNSSFHISPILFLVPVIVIGMIVMKVKAIPALFVGVLLGGVFAVILQPNIIEDKGRKNTLSLVFTNADEIDYVWSGSDDFVNKDIKFQDGGNIGLQIINHTKSDTLYASCYVPKGLEEDSKFEIEYLNGIHADDWGIQVNNDRSGYGISSYRTVINAMTADLSIETGNETVDGLLGTGGMFGMMNTIWLIICAMIFGGVLEKLGMLEKITSVLVAKAKTDGSLIATTALTCIGFNVTASDQYLAIVVPGKMYSDEFEKRGLAAENLSRTLEDTGTVTSVLVPWNTCGAAQSNVLGVATGEYMFFCFFNLISPIMTVTFGYLNIKIARLSNKNKGYREDTLID
jgi:NhaC family Na+:H+ antiporter